jgi:hypothetical protein
MPKPHPPVGWIAREAARFRAPASCDQQGRADDEAPAQRGVPPQRQPLDPAQRGERAGPAVMRFGIGIRFR